MITDAETICEMEAKEMAEAVEEFMREWRRWIDTRPDLSIEYGRPGMVWWKLLDALALADSRLREAFIRGDRSPVSMALYHRFRLNMILGKSDRVTA